MNHSIWIKDIDKKIQKKLDKDVEVDVLIIGGGMTGLSTAYHLIDKNLKVALVEKNTLFSGVTSKTTAKITYLQENIYSKLKTYMNEDISKQYLKSQMDAIQLLTNIIRENNIDCDLEKVTSYLFTNEDKKIEKIMKEKQLLEKFGNKVESTTELPDGEEVKCAISVSDTYVFHPIKYLNKIRDICQSNKIDFYEHSKIEKIEKKGEQYICYTKKNLIQAKYVVLALHYPYFLFPFLMPTKVSLEKSYVGAFQQEKNYPYSAITLGKPTKSIRYYENNNKIYKIELNGSHNISVKNNEQDNFENLAQMNDINYDYYWSNIDIITNDYLPFIGEIDNHLLIGTGYNTWGMTNATLAGKIISDIILKKQNEYIELFHPKRKINLAKIINFPIIVGSNMYSLLHSKMNLNKSWYPNQIKFEKRNQKKVGIYVDKENKEHIVYATCPHLKCNLIFNEVELTWDCPCHGSRFDIDGKCIEGPSNYDISYKE